MFTLLTLSAPWFWLGDVACHFRWQLGLGALPTAALTWFARWPRMAAASLLMGLFHTGPVLLLYMPGDGREASGETIVVGTANVLWSNTATEEVRDWIVGESPDVLAVLELDQRWLEVLLSLREEYPHQVIHPANLEWWTKETFGIALISRLPLGDVCITKTQQDSWPVLRASVQVDGRWLDLYAVHAPRPGNRWRVDHRARVLRDLGDQEQLPWDPNDVLMGDLNLSSYSPQFARLLDTTGLRDSRRGFGRHGTFTLEVDDWLPFVAMTLSLPIDHILVGDEVAVVDRRTSRITGSDHRAVFARLGWR